MNNTLEKPVTNCGKLIAKLSTDAEITDISKALHAGYNVRLGDSETLVTIESIEAQIDTLSDELFTHKPVSFSRGPIVEEIKTSTQKEIKEEIKENLQENDKALINGLLTIYNFQTKDEQDSHAVLHSNGVGFTGTDARILTSFSEQVLKKLSSGTPIEQTLSDKQKEIARAAMPKYAGQLLRISNG
jgi:hypothetical protein